MVDWAEEKEVAADNIVSFSLYTATELYGCLSGGGYGGGYGITARYIKPKPVKEPSWRMREWRQGHCTFSYLYCLVV